jgi:hypothetical protein
MVSLGAKVVSLVAKTGFGGAKLVSLGAKMTFR